MADLDDKVRAVNAANAYAVNVVYPQLIEFFRPYVGRKIFKTHVGGQGGFGSYRKKIADELPQFQRDGVVSVHREPFSLSLAYSVVVRAGQSQHKTTIYVGTVTDGALDSLQPAPELRSDYTAGWVAEARERFRQAKRAYEAAQDELADFGAY